VEDLSSQVQTSLKKQTELEAKVELLMSQKCSRSIAVKTDLNCGYGYVCHILMVYLLPLCLMWVGIYLYFISNQVLIKFDQLKC
jgi:hypothetical protein